MANHLMCQDRYEEARALYQVNQVSVSSKRKVLVPVCVCVCVCVCVHACV